MSDVKRRVQHGSLYISKSNGTIRTYPLRLLRQLPTSSSGRLRSRIQAHAYSVPESPQSIEKVKVVLEKHPWYTTQWQGRLQDVPIADRDMVLFYAGGEVG